MNEAANSDIASLKELIKDFGGVDSYTTQQAAAIFELLYKILGKMGLDPTDRADIFKGLRRIFNIELVNYADYEHGKYIFVPNHVSEFDGLIFGTLIPNMLVVAKTDWISNPHLNEFINRLFKVVGLKRKDGSSGISVLKRCVEHLLKSENGAVNIFVQQTIADIDMTTADDVASGAYYIAKRTSAKIIPVYSEQVSAEAPTRIVFGSPLECDDKDDFGEIWMKIELALRDSISDPAARPPVLCEKHRKPISLRDF